jgi:hypothetical protein
VDVLTTLGRTMGFSFAAGINLYATVAILGLASRFDWVSLPPQFKVFDNDIVIVAALVMYVIEFVADKVPWVDSMWDAAHTVIRPVGGALIAVANTSPEPFSKWILSISEDLFVVGLGMLALKYPAAAAVVVVVGVVLILVFASWIIRAVRRRWRRPRDQFAQP